MNSYKAILIECDNTKSLGGSCERDVYNIYKKLVENKVLIQNIYILTNNPMYFISKNIKINLCTSTLSSLQKVLSSSMDNLYIHISGHGYQGSDIKRIELDNKSENIVLASGTLTDYQFNELLVSRLKKDARLRISVDTCHSGSFSNFTNQIVNNTKTMVTKKAPYFTNAYSISACKDNESDMCDIGDVGFGGSLTVHILEGNSFNEFLVGDPMKTRDNVSVILKLLNQTPVLLIDN